MDAQTDREQELDSGGFGRLDISDVAPEGAEVEGEGKASSPRLCDWCREKRSGDEYVVIADNRHYLLCPTCWGRSATYVEVRHLGFSHADAVAHESTVLASMWRAVRASANLVTTLFAQGRDVLATRVCGDNSKSS